MLELMNHTTHLNRVSSPDQLQSLISIHADYDTYQFTCTSDDVSKYATLLEKPHSLLSLAVRSDGEPVGFLASCEERVPGFLYIEDLVVDNSAQSSELGGQLLEEAIAFAQAENLQGVCTRVAHWNLPAQELYQAYHFREEKKQKHEGMINYLLEF